MKYCNDHAALLDLYVDGELSAEDMIRVQEHLDSCPGCQAYVDDALAIRAAFPDAEETVVPDGFAVKVMDSVRKAPRQRRKNTPWAKILAPLAACFALAIVLQQLPFGGSKTSMLTKNFAPAAAEEQTTAESAAESFSNQYAYSAGVEDVKAEPEMEAPMAALTEGGSGTNLESDIVELEAEPAEPEAVEDKKTATAVYQTVLFLPAEAAELLADFTPAEETETEEHYYLFMSDCALIQSRLEKAEISYMVEEAIDPNINKALIILSK